MNGLNLRNIGFVGSNYSPLTSLTFINSATNGSGTNLTIPSESQPGDIIIYVMSITTSSVVLQPIGNYTALQESNTAGSYRIAYKILDTSDVGGVTEIANDRQIIALLFRPNGIISTVSTSSFSSQQTSAAPTNQTLPALSSITYPVISLAHYRASGVVSTRGSTLAMTELTASTSSYLKYSLNNPGTTLGANTISMVDNGANLMQSLYITVQ